MIRDLLNPSSGFLDLREDSRGSIQIPGITEVSTSNAQEVRVLGSPEGGGPQTGPLCSHSSRGGARHTAPAISGRGDAAPAATAPSPGPRSGQTSPICHPFPSAAPQPVRVSCRLEATCPEQACRSQAHSPLSCPSAPHSPCWPTPHTALGVGLLPARDPCASFLPPGPAQLPRDPATCP